MKSYRELAVSGTMMVLDENKYSHLVLKEIINQTADITDRKLLTKLFEGTIENVILIDYVINQFSKVKTKKLKPFIRGVLRVSVYQILFMDSIPDFAVCNEAIKLVMKRKMSGLKGYCNAVLRNIARNKDNIKLPDEKKNPMDYLSIKYSMPLWIVEKFINDYGMEKAIDILENTHKKNIYARINFSKADKESVINSLKKDNINVEETYLNGALKLSGIDNMEKIDALKKGHIIIQDISSMYVTIVADIKEGDTVIDMCAAPGGKTMHILDVLNGTGKVFSRDVSDKKVKLINENIKRTGFKNAVVEKKDGMVFYKEDENMADVVIVDVPCSGLGVISKKPEIKYRLKKEDIDELTSISKKIVENMVRYVKPGKTFVYSTCTITPEENVLMREWILNNFDVKPVSIIDFFDDEMKEKHKDTLKEGYIQMLPDKEHDGFFISKFEKR